MYLDYFRLNQKPFSIAPDPSFLYMSERHREALAHLMYGLTSEGGFVLITGEVGTGKTTLLRSVVEQIPENQDVAFILNPRLTVRELLETLCDELGIQYETSQPMTVKHYIDRLNKHLLKTHGLGRSTVVIIDEAQNLSPAVLEQVRLLTNLETNERKLLRIILLGQPELSVLLNRNDLRQLAQRITARYHLRPLDREDTAAYIGHRLSISGGNEHLFTASAMRVLYKITKGVPRLINILADRALLGAYVEGKQRVTRAITRKARIEAFGRPRRAKWWWVVAASATISMGAAWAYFEGTTADGVLSGITPALAGIPTPMPVAQPSRPAPADLAARAVHEPAQAEPQDAALNIVGPFTRPDGVRMSNSRRDAFASIFQVWQVPFDPAEVPCDQTAALGLQCLKQRGTFDELEDMNRPAVIELWDEAGDPFYAALLGKIDDGYRLRIGDTTHEVARAALQLLWFGSYTVLWKTPPFYVHTLRLDDVGPSVAWLRQNLEQVTGTSLSTPTPAHFDARLQRTVSEYQRRHALRPDGIVGPHTVIRLNSDAGLIPATLNGPR
ncbi:MAG: AAA family ATPase [Gammaproteobacteria bacterium]|nr:AAA family ATPase [Gammaproteobacteria bacterium]